VVRDWTGAVPDDAEAQLRARLRRELRLGGFGDRTLDVEMIRMEPTVRWVCAFERRRRAAGWVPNVEIWLSASLPTPVGELALKAKSDRVDVHAEQGLEIIDFKSGSAASATQVASMMAAQLPVTALIAEMGGSDRIAGGEGATTGLSYIKVGTRYPERREVRGANVPDVPSLVAKARETLVQLHVRYADPAMPYLSKPRVQFLNKAGYDEPEDRLARRAEWTEAEDTGGEA
jgi:ATP-dependent helicase/nuclease subunit B